MISYCGEHLIDLGRDDVVSLLSFLFVRVQVVQVKVQFKTIFLIEFFFLLNLKF